MHCRPPVTLLIMWVSHPKCIYSVFLIPPVTEGLWAVGTGGRSPVDVVQKGSPQN